MEFACATARPFFAAESNHAHVLAYVNPAVHEMFREVLLRNCTSDNALAGLQIQTRVGFLQAPHLALRPS